MRHLKEFVPTQWATNIIQTAAPTVWEEHAVVERRAVQEADGDATGALVYVEEVANAMPRAVVKVPAILPQLGPRARVQIRACRVHVRTLHTLTRHISVAVDIQSIIIIV